MIKYIRRLIKKPGARYSRNNKKREFKCRGLIGDLLKTPKKEDAREPWTVSVCFNPGVVSGVGARNKGSREIRRLISHTECVNEQARSRRSQSKLGQRKVDSTSSEKELRVQLRQEDCVRRSGKYSQ